MKTAILTGVSSGIGEAIANVLSKNGWQIIGLYNQTESDESLTKTYRIDLSDLAATAELGKRLASELSQVDALIHVAGLWHNDHEVLADKQLKQFTPEQIVASMNVGVTAAMVLCNALLPIMKQGSVIGISGTFSDGASGWLPYYTSKRALEDFLVGLSQDAKDVQVFGISPADTATPAYKKFYPQYAAEAQTPEAVAKFVLELLAGQNDFRSGDIIEVRQGKTTKNFHG